MAPNSIGAFLFKHLRENRNLEPCLSTLSRFRTWRPTAVTALETSIVSQHQKKDSNTKRTSFCPDTSTMSRSLLNRRHSLHGDQRMGLNPKAMWINFKLISTWHPTLKGLLSKKKKKRLEKSHDPVDWKSTKSKSNTITPKFGLRFFFLSKTKEKRIWKSETWPCPSTLSRLSTWRLRLKSYDFFYKSTLQTSFWKEMCQKSNIDTIIDIPKNNLE